MACPPRRMRMLYVSSHAETADRGNGYGSFRTRNALPFRFLVVWGVDARRDRIGLPEPLVLQATWRRRSGVPVSEDVRRRARSRSGRLPSGSFHVSRMPAQANGSLVSIVMRIGRLPSPAHCRSIRQPRSGSETSSAFRECCPTGNRYRPYPDRIDDFSCRSDLYPSDPGCVTPGGQLGLVHRPEPTGSRGGIASIQRVL